FFVALGALYCSEAATAETIHAEARRALGLVVGGVGLCIVGAIDDTRRLPAVSKLFAQIAAAVIAFACGFRIDAVLLPVLGTLSMGIFALPVTTLWIVGVTNAINLIDGLDGLAGGVVFFAALTNLVVAQVTHSTFVGVTMSAMLGSVLGFLLFNFNPARIFMGDSGSYFLGFVLGTMSLASASQKASTAVSLLVPVVALGLPILDTLLSIVRRVLEKRPLFSPDRGHIHHRLLDMGLTHRRAVLMLYGICVVLTSAAIAVSLGRTWTVGIALLVASLVAVGIARFAGNLQHIFIVRRQRARLRSPDTELLRRVVPDAPSLFAAARDEDEVWVALQEVVSRSAFSSAELIGANGTERRVSSGGHATANLGDTNRVSARYPIGPDALARAELKFCWLSDYSEVSPQTEVLLQVIVDVLAMALTRVGSRHAPALEEAPAVEDERLSTPALNLPGAG
ncbi:MAG TPA: MraY family glycosyltransferase, partial [Polyangiaceae bacterium]|nr:MraY family glycosyltransferase [Polyangiaceae bacterium]